MIRKVLKRGVEVVVGGVLGSVVLPAMTSLMRKGHLGVSYGMCHEHGGIFLNFTLGPDCYDEDEGGGGQEDPPDPDRDEWHRNAMNAMNHQVPHRHPVTPLWN